MTARPRLPCADRAAGADGLLHQVHDITSNGDGVARASAPPRPAAPGTGIERTWPAAGRVRHALASAVASSHAWASEVVNLRRALSSRATIDQAKGIVMADRRCTPEEAFDVLSTPSQHANVRLADVASALASRLRPAGP